MREKQTPKKNVAFPELEASVIPVTIAKSRSLEPFVFSFVAAPENITQKPLGTLMGLFSISSHKEDSAYIVNHLAAIAKREYFLNPRRGAIESFESMLRRLNLALAETVKNGQVSWVGSLHGTVAAVEKQNIHFTVTGNATVVLYRNDRLLDIGEGLASPDAALHPIKTFAEISSGRLIPGDCLLFASPEVFDIFTLAELERNARRLVPEQRFARFIETALINELQIGSAVVTDIRENEEEPDMVGVEQSKRKNQKHPKKNYWSAKTFEESKTKKAEEVTTDILEEPKSEKTPPPKRKLFGDIYIQGDSLPEESEKHPALITLQWKLEDVRLEIRRLSNLLVKSVSDALSSLWSILADDIHLPFSTARRLIRRYFKKATSKSVEKVTEKVDIEPQKSLLSLPTIRIPSIHFPSIRPRIPDIPIPHINPTKLTRGMKRARSGWQKCLTYAVPFGHLVISGINRLSIFLKQLFLAGQRKFSALPQKTQLLVAMAVTFGFTLGGIVLWNILDQSDEAPVAVEEAPAAPTNTFPPTEERHATLVSPERTYDITGALLPLSLDGKLFVVTESGITDPESGVSYSAPGRIVTAAAMDDLDAIFVFTDARELFLFYPTNRRFIRNEIAFPGDAELRPIGTFLTYLYLLDPEAKQVYRFPRAEGGFGEGKAWLASPAPLEGITGGAVSENVYLYSKNEVFSFLRGRPDPAFSFERPATPITVTDLCAHPDTPDTFAILDAPAGRVLIYSKEGIIQKQLFDEELSDATACVLSNDGSTVAVSSQTKILLFATR